MTKSNRASRGRAILLGSVLALSAALRVSAADDIRYGINYDVIATDSSRTPDCKKDPNAGVHQKFVIPRYISPRMQEAVRGELKALRQSGFQSVRSVVELFPGAHPSGDLVNSGKIDDAVLASISEYVRDIHDAGFEELILAFATQGPANPACRKVDWGDCFDPATIPTSVEAEEKIIGAARQKGMALRVDLLNEACVSSRVPKLANDNFVKFIHAAVQMHAKRFPDIPATVSCQLERTGDGLASTQRLFAEGGDRISFFDIHAYPGAGRTEAKVLSQAAESLKGSNVPVIFGETTYGDPDYRQWIVSAYRESFKRDPPELIFWPLHTFASHCNFDVPHPYRLKDALGRQ
jgi:hypothetical protein